MAPLSDPPMAPLADHRLAPLGDHEVAPLSDLAMAPYGRSLTKVEEIVNTGQEVYHLRRLKRSPGRPV